MIEKMNRIIGRVLDGSGGGIAGVRVSAWKSEGEVYTVTETDSVGTYELFVTLGQWEVNAEPSAAVNLYNPDPPKRITVEAGVLSTVNFKLLSAESGISGTLVDASGAVLSIVYGFVSLSNSVDFVI